MKFIKTLSLLFFTTAMFTCAQDKRPIAGDTDFQRKINAEYKDASTSPLKDVDRQRFEGLDFFKFDAAYVVKASFVRTPNEKPFKMKTTTSRLPNYVKFGELAFSLKGKDYNLDIFQNLDLITKEGYEDYLFLPFLDDTNGDGSYGGGRYIDTRQPKSDIMTIDFNTAYNPYCAYNDRYSCPIVPRQNYVETRIEAGVKAFDKH